MTIPINVAGVWKDATPYINVAGVWTVADEGYIHDGVDNQLAFQNIQYYTSSGIRTSVNIFEDFGSPTSAGDFVWTNTGSIESGSAGTYAVTIGAFPVGSTLKIINQSYFRGRGGKGGNAFISGTNTAGEPGQTALNLTMDVTIDNGAGFIFGGGGGGGASNGLGGKQNWASGGGGGAGDDGGPGGTADGGNPRTGATGTQTSGGAGGNTANAVAGNGGSNGNAGTVGNHSGTGQDSAGGAGGKSIALNGYTVTWLSGNDSTHVKGAQA